MGKTKAKPSVKAAPAAIVPTSSSATSTSSSASANSYQNLIRALFSIPEGESEDRTEILKKLASEYRQLASSNHLNTLKDRYLSDELQEIQSKHADASAEYTRTKAEHDALNSKYFKLKQLSQTLSDRTKQADANAAAALHQEQQKRVKLTESFSGSIASISSKLDSLTARREMVVTENAQLKAILKSYLEEFDADQRAQQPPAEVAASVEPELMESISDESPPALDPPAEVADASSSTERVTAGAIDDATSTPVIDGVEREEISTTEAAVPIEGVEPVDPAATEAALQAERAAEAANSELMAFAEDVTRLNALKATEHELRLKTAKYSALFDSFQTKLAGCNAGFQSKQTSIEALSKEMVLLEKENAIISKRVADCVMSTKVMMNMHGNTLAETQKQVKVMERYAGLIDLLQKEIDAAVVAK